MVEIERRALLSATGAAFALASHAHAQTQPADDRDGAYRFFSAAEAELVEIAVDRLIPPDPEHPGALAAGAPRYIDLQLAGPYGSGERLYLEGPIKPGTPEQGYQLGLTPAELYRRFLAAITDDLKTRRIALASADDADKDSYLRLLERGDLQADGISSAVFFETLLANTVEGFFCDPAHGGNRDMAAWRMIGFPGAYAAYLGIYTQHGIRFDRPPLAMTSGHGHRHSTR
jgi:gluconate 2-dehydrogenase gamma chain